MQQAVRGRELTRNCNWEYLIYWEYLIQFSTVLLTSFTKILLTQSVAEVQGLSKELLDLKWHPT